MPASTPPSGPASGPASGPPSRPRVGLLPEHAARAPMANQGAILIGGIFMLGDGRPWPGRWQTLVAPYGRSGSPRGIGLTASEYQVKPGALSARSGGPPAT